MNHPTNCPHCNTNLLGEPVPQEYIDKGYYPKGCHYKREIGIDGGYMGLYDGIVALRCPDCKKEWPVDDSKWAMDVYAKYLLVKDTKFNPW